VPSIFSNNRSASHRPIIRIQRRTFGTGIGVLDRTKFRARASGPACHPGAVFTVVSGQRSSSGARISDIDGGEDIRRCSMTLSSVQVYLHKSVKSGGNKLCIEFSCGCMICSYRLWSCFELRRNVKCAKNIATMKVRPAATC
jgi:hypothetical protein